MPQMSPMWWLFLMICSISTLLMMNSIIYFNLISLKTQMKTIQKNKIIWKW
nr:ATP synthase F0 subunit 8 [Ujna puerana]